MVIDKNTVKKILFISLSNLGDIILTTPVFNKLLEEFPAAGVDVITGKPGKDIFSLHPAVIDLMFHGGHRTLARRISGAMALRRVKYDLVVDLKNSMLPFVLGARYKTGPVQPFKKRYFAEKGLSPHKVNEHLYKLAGLGIDPFKRYSFFMPFVPGDECKASEVLGMSTPGRRKILISPGAKSHLKRWPAQRFAELSDMLVRDHDCDVFVAGNTDDIGVRDALISAAKEPVFDLCGKTPLGVLAVIMKKTDLVITNDSAPLHMASAMNAPTVAIFGPTDERKYGPLAEKKSIVTPERKCRPCEKALCSAGQNEGCIIDVTVEQVYQAAVEMLDN
jgi:heptosyltransferase-3